ARCRSARLAAEVRRWIPSAPRRAVLAPRGGAGAPGRTGRPDPGEAPRAGALGLGEEPLLSAQVRRRGRLPRFAAHAARPGALSRGAEERAARAGGGLVGVERLGAAAFPFGAGVAGQTLMGVSWAREMKPTAFYGTPSYALHFADTARREGIDPRSLGLRVLFFSGEPGAGIPSTKKQIEETFGAACTYMRYTAEMSPWMTDL